MPVNAETSPASPGRAEAPTAAVASDPKRWFALAVISVCQLMLVLDSSIMNIALPHAQHALGISDADRQWVVTAYTLGFGGLLLLGGRVADFVGRKRVFIAGLLGFAVASALGGIAGNGPLLYASRGLQGIFAAAMAPAALSLLTTTFTETRERARAFSVYGGISGGGAALGLVLGGLLTQYASWRWCLLVNVPIALVTAAAAGYVLKESRATGITRYDVRGALLATAGLTALVYGFANAGTHGWASASTVAVLAGAVVLLVLFFIVEAGNEHALLPLRLLRNRDRAGAYLTATLAAAGVASALVNTTQQIGGSLGTALLNTVAASATATALAVHPHLVQEAAVHGYRVAFAVAAAILLAGSATVLVMVRARRDDLPAGHQPAAL